MKISIIRIVVSWLMVILTMIIIFNFSEKDSKDSMETSEGVIKDILEVVLPEEEITPEKITKLQFPIRKLAHFGIYMLLGLSLSCALVYSLKIKKLFIFSISLVLSFCYACLDEWHQSYTGRTQAFTDVLIDTGGALIGIVIFVLIFYLCERLKLKNKNPSA